MKMRMIFSIMNTTISSSIILNFLFLFLTGMAVYNVFIVCTIGVPLAIYSDKQAYEFSFYVITISIFFCTTLTLCLVFVPKVCIKYLFWLPLSFLDATVSRSLNLYCTDK